MKNGSGESENISGIGGSVSAMKVMAKAAAKAYHQ
jgi:hypothetical protein